VYTKETKKTKNLVLRPWLDRAHPSLVERADMAAQKPLKTVDGRSFRM
jgi:hypothetical protein